MSTGYTVFALSFEEDFAGKTFGVTKMKSRYEIIINYKLILKIEIINSKFSNKKTILLNSDPMFVGTCPTKDFRHQFSYKIPDDGGEVQFAVFPSPNGLDLKIDGRDFFDYVHQVSPESGRGPQNGSSTRMKFILPSVPLTLDKPKPPQVRTPPQVPAPVEPEPVRVLIEADAARAKGLGNQYAAFEDDEQTNKH
jgi:hypothetical protein